MSTLLIWIGLSAGNFIYQFFTGSDWPHAMMLSYYQGIALLAAYFFNRRS